MADFSTDVSAWCDKAGGRATLVLRTICWDVLNRIKELTPVDTGFLRSNWTAIIEGEAEPIAGRVPDPAKALMTVKVGQIVVILNPTVYARRIEYGFVGEDIAGRQFNQMGVHMVAQTLTELPAIAAAAVARVSGAS